MHPGTGRGDRLPVHVVLHVARGEDAGHRGDGRIGLGDDVAVLVELQLPGEQRGVRRVPDRDEHPADRKLAQCIGLGVAQAHRFELAVADDIVDDGVPAHVDLRVGEDAVLHDLRRAQLLAAVDQRDVRRETGEEVGFLERGVAAAHDGDRKVAEEESVARRARRHAVPEQALLGFEAEHPRGRAGRDDHRAGEVFGVADADARTAIPTGRCGRRRRSRTRRRSGRPARGTASSAPGRGCRRGIPGSSRRRSSA